MITENSTTCEVDSWQLMDLWDANNEEEFSAFGEQVIDQRVHFPSERQSPVRVAVDSSSTGCNETRQSYSFPSFDISATQSLSSNSTFSPVSSSTTKRRRRADEENTLNYNEVVAAIQSKRERNLQECCSFDAVGDDEDSSASEDTSELLAAIHSIPYSAVRRMRRRMMRIPILPKSDVRRSYLRMFSNTINSHDALLLKRFLMTYCQPTVELKHIGQGQSQYSSLVSPLLNTPGRSVSYYQHLSRKSEFMKNQFHLKRVQEIFAFFAVKNDLHVDNVCRFVDIRVVTSRASDRVRLEGRFIGTRTDIYEMNPAIMYNLFTNKMQEHMGEFLDTHDNHAAIAEQFGMQTFGKLDVYSLPLSSEPMLVNLEGLFAFIIGADKRIEQIELQPIGLKYTPVNIARI